MEQLHKRLAVLKKNFTEAEAQLGLTQKEAELDRLEHTLAQPEIWNDPMRATSLNKQFAQQQAFVQPWQALRMQLRDIAELMELGDDSLQDEFSGQIAAMEADFADLKKALLLNGEYDESGAIVRITAGVGGTDAQDFAEMLERMYLRWSHKQEFNTVNIERSAGDEAGLKTSVIEVNGLHAYGRLKSEHGVHRLVRLSPFNSDNLRQTSFALVEILPQIDAPEAVKLDERDLKIDVYRAGGHGGQSVNTTDSAVRVTHLPTGVVAAIQNERSQIQNKETALKILRSKLAQLKLEQHAETLSDLRAGESANWGSQIRNYVLHPYTLVKDTRTKFEDKDAKAVLGGKLDGFMTAYLEMYMHQND